MFSEEAVSSVCGEWLAWFLKFVFGTGINSDCLQFGGKCQNKHHFFPQTRLLVELRKCPPLTTTHTWEKHAQIEKQHSLLNQ